MKKIFKSIDFDCNLSLQDKGLYFVLKEMKKQGRKIRFDKLKEFNDNGKHTIYKSRKKLIENGYLKFIKKRDEKGRFCGIDYKVI